MTDTPVKYYEDYLSKKEGKGKWKEYWAVLRGSWILFYSNKIVTEKSNFCGSIELHKDTKCSLGKRRTYSFPFYITTQKGTHLFKCATNLKRHQWIYVLGLAIKCQPPVPPPSFVPKISIRDDDGDHISSWDTQRTDDNNTVVDQTYNTGINNVGVDDSDDDDDDTLSIPSGVIFVTTLPDDLASVEGDDEKLREREKVLNSINKENNDRIKEVKVSHNAVLSTGISGTTTIVQEKIKTNLFGSKAFLSKPVCNKPISKSTGSLRNSKPVKNKYLFVSSVSRLDERPSTTPLPSVSHRPPLTYPGMNTFTNLKFSRHMTNSTPDVKSLVIDGGTNGH